MEASVLDNLIHLDAAVTVHLNYKRLGELYGDEGDVVIVTTRDPDNPNRLTIEARLPNMPIREMFQPKTEQPAPVANPVPRPFPKILFDLDHPLSEIPKQLETPLDPTAETGNRDMQETKLEFPRERIVVQRMGKETIMERLSESEWYMFKAVTDAGETGVDFDDLFEIVPTWKGGAEYNVVYQMINSLNAKIERLGIVYHIWTAGFAAFTKFGKRPVRAKRKR